jgi:uncharacterized membrane protein YgdD (TMEM256/DUF423 family)
MVNRSIAAGAIFAMLSVVLGAFAAHGLQQYVESGLMDDKMLRNFETGARYQMYHAIAIMICGIISRFHTETNWLHASFWLFITGILLFSGSLYLLSARNVIGLESWHWLGPVTPLGGVAFIAGWIMLVLHAMQKK